MSKRGIGPVLFLAAIQNQKGPYSDEEPSMWSVPHDLTSC